MSSYYAPEKAEDTTKAPIEDEIREACREVEELLVAKNRQYGNSALEPVRVFSRASNDEQLRVRLDDKLSRIARGNDWEEDEDVVLDLIGYLLLLRISRKQG